MELVAYTSQASAGVDGSDVFGIVAVSARNNVNAGLTGVLFFKDSRFFQILEGSPDEIDHLLGKLQEDSRHHSVEIVSRTVTQQRYFPEWNMKRVFNLNADEESAQVREKVASLANGDGLCRELARFFDGENFKAA